MQNITGETAGLEALKKMKTRIISAAVLLPVLLIIVLALPTVFTAILVGLMAAIAVYELLHGTALVTHIRLVVYSMVMAFLVAMWSYFDRSHVWAMLGVLVFTMLLFAEMMASHVRIRFEKLAMCFFAGVVLPLLFTSLVRIHEVKATGRFFIFIPFVMAFLSDTGAYFAGRFFGTHKLAPVISPNKTVEGAVGGVLMAMVGMLLYCVILQLIFKFRVNYLYALIYGLLGSVCAVFGDLCFSVIKRQTGIKDYGKLIPGHGGILDRFDSMMVVGPLAEILLTLIPLAVR